MLYIIIYLAVYSYILTAIICGRMFYAFMQGEFKSIAKESKREDLGWSILVGGFCGLLGPIGIILSMLQTGFAKHFWESK